MSRNWRNKKSSCTQLKWFFKASLLGGLWRFHWTFFTDRIEDDGIAAICSMLEKNSSMSALNLSLWYCIREPVTVLSHLFLTACRMSESGRKQLFSTIGSRIFLSTLRLQSLWWTETFLMLWWITWKHRVSVGKCRCFRVVSSIGKECLFDMLRFEWFHCLLGYVSVLTSFLNIRKHYWWWWS